VIYHSGSASTGAVPCYNWALIALDDAPGIQMPSRLPGTPVDEVPLDATVEVVFQQTPVTGQKIPEWRVVGAPASPCASWMEPQAKGRPLSLETPGILPY
jgi:hypothetical protein